MLAQKKRKIDNDNHVICPITREPIKILGITCVGSCYDAMAIEKWLTTNKNDPLTGLYLSTKKILKYNLESLFAKDVSLDLKKQYVQQQSNHYRLNTRTWDPIVQHIDMNKYFLKKYTVKIKQINKLSLEQKAKWKVYTYQKINQIWNGKNLSAWYTNVKKNISGTETVDPQTYDDHIDNEDYNPMCVLRPLDFTTDFEFLNLSLSTNKLLQNKSFKESSFMGSNFSGLVCMDCGFCSCNFSVTNLQNTTFINCSFTGKTDTIKYR